MAARYWISGGTGNWNSTTNWSTTSGGASGSAVPTNADDVTFDLNSGNCTVNVAGVCLSLRFTGYTATITMTNGITVGSSGVASSITLQANQSSRVAGTGGLTSISTCTLTSNGGTWPNNLTFGSGNPSFTANFIDDWNTGSLTTASNGATLTNRTIYVTGNVSLTAGVGSSSTTNIEMNGTGTQTLGASSGSFPVTCGININKSSGQFVLSGTFYWRGTTGKTFKFTSASSTLTTGSTLSFDGGGTNGSIDISGLTLNNLNFGSGGASQTYTLLSHIYTTGTTTTALNGVNLTGAYKIYIRGNFTKGSPFANGGTFLGLEFDGTGNQIWGDTYTSGNLNVEVIINKITGTLTLGTTTTQTIRWGTTNNVLTHTSGTIDPQSTTFSSAASTTLNISSSGFILYNWTPAAGTHTINTGTITMNNNLTLAGNTTFAGTGGWSSANWTENTAGRTISFKDGSTYTVTSALSLVGTNASPIVFASSSATLRTIFTLNQGATQTIQFVTATRVDSSGGQTMWDTLGTGAVLTDNLNWNSGSKPAPFNTLRMN